MINKSHLSKPGTGGVGHTQGTDQGLDAGGPNAVTVGQIVAAVSGFNAITYSLFEKGWGETLIPADGLVWYHMGGLWEEDADGNFMPKVSPDASIDTFFTLDDSDNIQPSA